MHPELAQMTEDGEEETQVLKTKDGPVFQVQKVKKKKHGVPPQKPSFSKPLSIVLKPDPMPQKASTKEEKTRPTFKPMAIKRPVPTLLQPPEVQSDNEEEEKYIKYKKEPKRQDPVKMPSLYNQQKPEPLPRAAPFYEKLKHDQFLATPMSMFDYTKQDSLINQPPPLFDQVSKDPLA